MPDELVQTTDSALGKGGITNEIGDTGTIIYGGFLTLADYNPDLSGIQRIEIYDQMRLGDSTVKLGLSAVKYPLLATNWYIKKADEEKDKDEIADFVTSQLINNPFFTWTSFLRQVLTFCEFGNAIFEKVYIKTPDGKIGWKKFGHRMSKTIYRWTLNDGKTPGIVQMLPTGGTKEIPAWKLLPFVLDQEGSNYEGISLCRSAYKHWYYKEAYYRIDSVATEKQGLGIPQLTTPPNAKPADLSKAREVVRNMRVHQQAYAELPQGFKIEFLDMKALQIKSAEQMILHHDRQIAKAFLAQFLEIGSQGSSGAFAASQDQSELFYKGLEHLAKTVQEMMNKAIRELVDLNFGPQELYPTLEYGTISNIDAQKYADALQKLAGAQILIPDDELEDNVRQTMKLPAKMEGYDRETLDKKKQEETQMTQEHDLTLLKTKLDASPVDDPKDRSQDRPPKKLVNAESLSFTEELKALREDIHTTLNEQSNS